MFIRPARMADHGNVMTLARQAGFGMTSLPPDAEVLAAKIEASEASFAGRYPKPGQESYFFVLEDTERGGGVVGTCAIKARIGLTQPFYSYKLTTITQASLQLNIFSQQTLLQVTNDLTGSTEIGGLFLAPGYRRDRIGTLISFARFLFIANHPERFANQIIAEMRGVHDHEGNAPFYNALPRKFFKMPFTKADYINATQGNQFINDLMPKYPIYLSLLSKSGREVVGQVNAASEPAKVMLERQGFRYQGYIDIFDGGPTLCAEKSQIEVVRSSVLRTVIGIEELPEDTPKTMLATLGFEDFRCALGRARITPEGVTLTPRFAARVQVAIGDTVRGYALS